MSYEMTEEFERFMHELRKGTIKESTSVLQERIYSSLGLPEKYINKESVKSMKAATIIDLWKERQMEKINEYETQETDKIYEEDSFYKEVKTNMDKLNSLISTNGYPLIDVDLYRYTLNVSDGKFETLHFIVSEKINVLKEKYKEISAMLRACETYEQEMAVLVSYGVVEVRGGSYRMI